MWNDDEKIGRRRGDWLWALTWLVGLGLAGWLYDPSPGCAESGQFDLADHYGGTCTIVGHYLTGDSACDCDEMADDEPE